MRGYRNFLVGLGSLLLAGCAEINNLEQDSTSVVSSQKSDNDGKDKLQKTTDLMDAAQISEKQKDYNTAAAFFGTLYERDTHNIDALEGYARNMRKAGLAGQAVPVLYQYFAQNKPNHKLRRELVKLLLTANYEKDALMQADLLTSSPQTNWQDWMLKAAAADKVRNFSIARPAYERAIALAPENPVIWNNYAMSYMQEGQYQKAEKMARKAISLPNAPEQAFYNLSKILITMDRKNDAMQVLQNRDSSQADQLYQQILSEISQPRRW